MPTRKRLTILRKNGDRIACATVKMTTAVMNPDALTDTPGISHAAANNPIAEDPRKIAVRKESGSRQRAYALLLLHEHHVLLDGIAWDM